MLCSPDGLEGERMIAYTKEEGMEKGMDVENIASVSGLSVEQIQSL